MLFTVLLLLIVVLIFTQYGEKEFDENVFLNNNHKNSGLDNVKPDSRQM